MKAVVYAYSSYQVLSYPYFCPLKITLDLFLIGIRKYDIRRHNVSLEHSKWMPIKEEFIHPILLNVNPTVYVKITHEHSP